MIGLPSPWVLLAALGVAVGAFFYGSHVGATAQIAKQATNELLIAKAGEAAQHGAATEIAKIQIVNKTIQSKVETITREVPVYSECHNTPDALRLLNGALSNQPGSVSLDGSKLPDAHPTH